METGFYLLNRLLAAILVHPLGTLIPARVHLLNVIYVSNSFLRQRFIFWNHVKTTCTAVHKRIYNFFHLQNTNTHIEWKQTFDIFMQRRILQSVLIFQ